MFKYMYNDADNNLASKFEAFGLDDTDRIFIEEQISGPIGKGNDVRLLIIYFVEYKIWMIIQNKTKTYLIRDNH